MDQEAYPVYLEKMAMKDVMENPDQWVRQAHLENEVYLACLVYQVPKAIVAFLV